MLNVLGRVCLPRRRRISSTPQNRTTRTKTHPRPLSEFALKPRSVRPALSQAHQPSYQGGPQRLPMRGGALYRAVRLSPTVQLLTLAAHAPVRQIDRSHLQLLFYLLQL
eukprot:COSAG01_NODE_3928_length_5526_cov_8.623803_3_plen_109_part_00